MKTDTKQRYTFEQLTNYTPDTVPQEVKVDFRKRIREILIDIVELKRLHRQGDWHTAEADKIEEAFDHIQYYDKNITIEQIHHCESAHCLAGHVEMDIIDEIGLKGSYKSDACNDTYWHDGKKLTEEMYSPLIQKFIETNQDKYESYGDGRVAMFVATMAGLSEYESDHLFAGDLTIAHMICAWNCICVKNGWDGYLGKNLSIPEHIFERACYESEIEHLDELHEEVHRGLMQYSPLYYNVFDDEGVCISSKVKS